MGRVKRAGGAVRQLVWAGLLVLAMTLLGPGCKKSEAPSKDLPPPPPYGPIPYSGCESDEECVQIYGQGWYCNQAHQSPGPPMPMCEPKK